MRSVSGLKLCCAVFEGTSRCRFFENRCGHRQPCKNVEAGGHCSHRNRKHKIDILHGSLLPCWQTLLDTTIASSYTTREKFDEEGCAPAAAATSVPALRTQTRACLCSF